LLELSIQFLTAKYAKRRKVDMAWDDRSVETTEYTEGTEVVEGLGLSYKSYRTYSKGCAFTILNSLFTIQAQRQVHYSKFTILRGSPGHGLAMIR
jgi:hypothetical protein